MPESGELPALAPAVRGSRRERSDAELIGAVRAGSAAAAETLVDRHWDRAHRVAFAILADPHLAEEVTQESMVSILARVGRFDTRRPFEPWLHRVVANRALDYARARARRSQVHRLVAAPASESGSDPRLVEALAALPPDRRAVVVLRHVAGYGTNEIARILGIRRGTVGSRLRRGLDQLRSELEESDG
ncbi:MAG: sigma-70 family RNA polymerase sigma factor [Actinobacteria bacterium]|nr:sigma-70 family RNA polymerase sigma factor [Actinomycetota bacterium]